MEKGGEGSRGLSIYLFIYYFCWCSYFTFPLIAAVYAASIWSFGIWAPNTRFYAYLVFVQYLYSLCNSFLYRFLFSWIHLGFCIIIIFFIIIISNQYTWHSFLSYLRAITPAYIQNSCFVFFFKIILRFMCFEGYFQDNTYKGRQDLITLF